MPLGKSYFGGWLFLLALAAVILLGALRMRRKLSSLGEIKQLRQERSRLEAALAQVEAERSRVQSLKDRLVSKDFGASAEEN